jgi:hypothetical protein
MREEEHAPDFLMKKEEQASEVVLASSGKDVFMDLERVAVACMAHF